MKRGEQKIGWNKPVVTKMTKAEFVKMHQAAYPDTDLSKEYDSLVGKPAPESK